MMHVEQLPKSDPNERIVAELRRHWSVLTSLVVSCIAVCLLPILAYIVARQFIPGFFEDPVRLTMFVLVLSLVFLYAWLFLYQNYLDYYLDLWVVTNSRVLDIEQHGLFARTVSELRLHRVQDVTAEVHGFFETIFDFGNIYIQTAGEKERFEFEQVPHPNRVAKMILELSEKARKEDLEEVVTGFDLPDGPPRKTSPTPSATA